MNYYANKEIDKSKNLKVEENIFIFDGWESSMKFEKKWRRMLS